MSLDDHLCFALYSASMAVTRLYKPMLDELGITYPQYLVLNALKERWEAGFLTVGGLASRLALEPSTITPLVKRLEAAGLVTRTRSKEDEREVQVRLSRSGPGGHRPLRLSGRGPAGEVGHGPGRTGPAARSGAVVPDEGGGLGGQPGFLQRLVGLDDADQLGLGPAVAAVMVGVTAFQQGVIGEP
jgi:DNA-binding transcriptional ArsR family regulator